MCALGVYIASFVVHKHLSSPPAIPPWARLGASLREASEDHSSFRSLLVAQTHSLTEFDAGRVRPTAIVPDGSSGELQGFATMHHACNSLHVSARVYVLFVYLGTPQQFFLRSSSTSGTHQPPPGSTSRQAVATQCPASLVSS